MADGPVHLPPAPRDAIAPSGEPRFGAYAGSLDRVELLRAAPVGGVRGVLQRKRWVYVFAANEEAMIAAAVVEAGWFAAGFAWVLDRTLGTLAVDLSGAGLPGLNARVNDQPGVGARARFSGLGLTIDVKQDEERWELGIVGRNGFRAEVLLESRGAPAPFSLVTPVAGAGVRVTQKAAALAASGTIAIGPRTLLLDGGTGGVDSTHGFLARETGWRWAFGTGRLPGGAPIAFNLAEGFGGVPEGDPGENALFRSYETSRLPPVTFTFDREQLRAPWRVASADGSVDLTFTPAALHREVKNLAVLRTRFAQLPGVFHGTLPGAGGPVTIDALPGVVEDHWALW
jgi:hypothetical protein